MSRSIIYYWAMGLKEKLLLRSKINNWTNISNSFKKDFLRCRPRCWLSRMGSVTTLSSTPLANSNNWLVSIKDLEVSFSSRDLQKRYQSRKVNGVFDWYDLRWFFADIQRWCRSILHRACQFQILCQGYPWQKIPCRHEPCPELVDQQLWTQRESHRLRWWTRPFVLINKK